MSARLRLVQLALDAERRPPPIWAVVVLLLLAALDVLFLLASHRLGLGGWWIAAGAALFVVLALLVAFLVVARVRGTRPPEELSGVLADLRGLSHLQRRAAHLFGVRGLEELLQAIVDEATDLLQARYGALSVQGHEGRILEFVFTGLSVEHALLLAHPPQGEGLLGVPLRHHESLRMPDMSRDPRFVGFPEHHPHMTSLLAVPVPCSGPFRGNLYLADRRDDGEFSDEDEALLSRFAEVAGVAIDTAHMRERQEALAVAEERLRIAREMHDGMAQVLGYVNTKAQAVGDHLRAGRTDDAITHMEQLAAASREVYSEVREGILSLRSNRSPEADLQSDLSAFLARWRERTGIAVDARLDAVEDARLAPSAELQLLRVVQEALTNVRRHSEAERVVVTLAQEGHLLVAVVEDDGVGFEVGADPADGSGEHYGLVVMRERAEAVGGEVRVRSAPGEGTRVEVRVPLTPSGLPSSGRL